MAALVLVIGFWILQAPRTHLYIAYRLKQKLRSFGQPAETTLPAINDNTVKLPYGLAIDGVIAFYSTKVDCDVVRAYYKAEFARQGFSYANQEEVPGRESAGLRFSSSEFSGKLVCPLLSRQTQSDPILQRLSSTYVITMNWKTPRRV